MVVHLLVGQKGVSSLEYNAEVPKLSEILAALFLSINLLPAVKFSLDLREKFRACQISLQLFARRD